MASSSSSHGKRVFRKHFGSLTQCLTQQEDLLPLVVQFYSKGIIGDQLRNHISEASSISALQKTTKFLSAVEHYITDNPESIDTVIQLLMDSSPACKYVAEAMLLDMSTASDTVIHYGRSESKSQDYEKLARLQQQNSLPEVDHSDKTSSEPSQPFSTEATSSAKRAPLLKLSTFPQYDHPSDDMALTTSEVSKISLTGRSQSFPADDYFVKSPESLKPELPHAPSSDNDYQLPPKQENHQQVQKVSSTSTDTEPTLSQSATICHESLPANSVPSNSKSRVCMQCEVMNLKTAKPIKCTSSTNQNHPLFRNIKLKVKKFDTVLPNTPLQLRISADQACYVYVINIGSTGEETLLIPNEYETGNLLEADTQMLFPPPDAGYEFEVDENCGTETIVLLAYEQPLEKTEQASKDCRSLKAKDTTVVEESTELYRGIKIKPKKSKQEAIGFLEMQFASVSSK